MGDLIVGRAMGAYTWASATDFNFFPRARVVSANQFPGDRGRVLAVRDGDAASMRPIVRDAACQAPASVWWRAAPCCASRRAWSTSGDRRLAFFNTHTQEQLTEVVLLRRRAPIPAVLAQFNAVLRDHRSGEVGDDRPRAVRLSVRRGAACRGRAGFRGDLGFRSASSNDLLRASGGGGVARNSLHLQGKAIDVRLRAWSGRTCATSHSSSSAAASAITRSRISCTSTRAACEAGRLTGRRHSVSGRSMSAPTAAPPAWRRGRRCLRRTARRRSPAPLPCRRR